MNSDCKHVNLQAAVDAGAVGQTNSDVVLYYVAEVRMKCAACGMPFIFEGSFVGPDRNIPDKPFVQDVSAPVTRLCLPIRPAPEAKRWHAPKVN